MIVEELIALLGFDLTGEEKLARFTRGLDMAARGLAAFAARAAVFAAAAATAIGGGLALLGKGAIETGAKFEDMLSVLATVEGSSGKARASLEWVKQFATETPYALEEVSNAFVRLKANGLDPIPGLLESIGNATSAMNTPLMQGVEAIADAVRGENERLKEYAVNASVAGKKVTYTWTQNGKEFSKTVNKNAAEIQKALQEIFDARFAGAMSSRAKTFNGVLANIGDQWTNFLLKIADAGVFDFAKGQLQGFYDKLNELNDTGVLDQLAKSVSDTLVKVGTAVKDLLKSVTLEDVVGFINGSIAFLMGVGKIVGSLFTAIGAIGKFVSSLLGLKDTWRGVLLVLAGIGALIAPWAAAFAALLLVVDDFIAWLQGRPSLIGEALKAITATIEAWGPAISAAWASAVDALSKTGFGQFITGIVDQLKAFDLDKYFSGWGDSVSGLVDSFGKLGSAIADIGTSLSGIVQDSGAGDVFGKLAKGLGSLVGSEIVAGLQALKGVLKVIADSLTASANAAGKFLQGDIIGGFTELGKGLATVAIDVKDAIEKIIQAFIPDFSFMESWNAIADFFDGWADRISGWADRVTGLFDRVRNAFNFTGSGPVITPPAEGEKTGSIGGWIKNWWNGTDGENPVDKPQATPMGEQSGEAEPNSSSYRNTLADLSGTLQRFALQANSVNGANVGKMGETVANDNRVTNTTVEVSAPVTINATTNATAGEIGNSAASGVRNAGEQVGRNLAVVANPGTMTK